MRLCLIHKNIFKFTYEAKKFIFQLRTSLMCKNTGLFEAILFLKVIGVIFMTNAKAKGLSLSLLVSLAYHSIRNFYGIVHFINSSSSYPN